MPEYSYLFEAYKSYNKQIQEVLEIERFLENHIYDHKRKLIQGLVQFGCSMCKVLNNVSDYQYVFKYLQQVSNVVTNIPNNTGPIFVFTEKCFWGSPKGGSFPEKWNFKIFGMICCGYSKLVSQDAWNIVKGISLI
jgi:hypothetical protein